MTVVASLLRAPAEEEAAVVLSGCGTSGRYAPPSPQFLGRTVAIGDDGDDDVSNDV